MTRFARQYRRIARTLSTAELMRCSMDEAFDPRELVEGLGSSRFLSFYGDDGLRLALERYGILAAIAERGYESLTIETSCTDERHTLFVHGDAAPGRRERLVELVARRDRLVQRERPAGLEHNRPWEMLTIEWLMLRHPNGRFTEARPRLPGQDAPGLGLGEAVLELLFRVVERLKLDGLVGLAAHFHLAALYATEMRFLDPRAGGELLALQRTLLLGEGLTLAQASWAVEWGCVRREGESTPFDFHGEPQVWPRDEALARFLHSDAYAEACAQEAVTLQFVLDRAGFDARWDAELPSLVGSA